MKSGSLICEATNPEYVSVNIGGSRVTTSAGSATRSVPPDAGGAPPRLGWPQARTTSKIVPVRSSSTHRLIAFPLLAGRVSTAMRFDADAGLVLIHECQRKTWVVGDHGSLP